MLKEPRFWIRTVGAYPALIDPETAARVREQFPLQNDSPELYERQQRKVADSVRPRGEKRGGHTQPGDGINNHSRNSRWLLTGIAVCEACGGNLCGHRQASNGHGGGPWLYYQCGVYQRTGGSDCRYFYIPAEPFEGAVVESVAERLASDMGRREVRSRIRAVVGELRKDADQRVGALEREASAREYRARMVLEEGIPKGFDPQECNRLIRDLRAEAADCRDKARGYRTILSKADGIEDEVQGLLSSADRLLRTWNSLEVAERRARLAELVSAVVAHSEEQTGKVTQATVHFRGLLQDTQSTRVQIKTALAAKADVPDLTRLRTHEAEGAGSLSEWLPAPDSNQEPTG
ncbi:MAG: hypothetical protein FJX74_05145 [Armatimonadetes bacterium]|nr:hypothetical protein [Armatimonadota bacterium]